MKELLSFKYNSKFQAWSIIAIYTIIVLINILTLGEITNCLLTIIQYTIVITLLVKNNLKTATLLHFSFFILSLSVQKTLGMMGDGAFELYNYGSIKLLGPIRASYVMNILLVLICKTANLKPRKDLLFYKLYRTLFLMGGIATIIGLIGLIFHPYYTFEGFEGPVIYMFVVITTAYVLLCQASDDFIKSCYYLSVYSIMAGLFASYIGYAVFSVTSSYSVYEIVYCADCMWFAAIIVAGIFSIKDKGPLLLSLIVFALISINVMEGKSVINLFFALCVLAYYSFFDKKIKRAHPFLVRIIRPVIVISGLAIPVLLTFSTESMAIYKMQSAASMFSNDLDGMASSPYIRIASLFNIVYEGLQNPFILLFGNGYGGYFRDSLNMFVGIDLTEGAWPDHIISIGRFPNGHDTMVNVPLYNGLLGTYMICKICYLYIKKIKYNYMNGIAFMWIFLMFYFNTLFAVMGLFFLLGAELNLNTFENHNKALIKECPNIM